MNGLNKPAFRNKKAGLYLFRITRQPVIQKKVIVLEVIAFMLLVLFIGVIIMVNVFYRSAKKNQEVVNFVLPNLGIQDHTKKLKQQLASMVRHLDQSLDPEYVQQVKDCVMLEQKINEQEWENRWFEWKRLLLMTLICKNVPLYSREVDEIWHEILAIPDQYEAFSQRLIGQKFHHTPKLPTKGFDQNKRAWFDFVYHLLFQPTTFSRQTWGDFFLYPLPKEITKDFSTRTTKQLMEKYFQNEWDSHIPMFEETVKIMIVYIKQQLESFKEFDYEQIKKMTTKKRLDQALFTQFLYLSACDYDHYDEWKTSFPIARKAKEKGSKVIKQISK